MHCPTCGNTIVEDAAFCPECGTAVPDAPDYDEYEYVAFISYRHAPHDTEVAAKLHKALETYRLPKDVNAPSVEGAKSNRLGRAFRDKEELAASKSLPDRIRKALKASYALVVVCSPAARESAWVAQEVELFSSYHGRDRIFLALAEGEPDDSTPPLLLKRTVVAEDDITEEPVEPLAADFRNANRKQFHAESLRIVAGILNCKYDDLRKREQTRQRKKLAGVAIGIVALALLIGALAQYAAGSHRQAQIEESKSLAAQSQQQFAAGDRYGAIKTALSALPSDNDPNRPMVDEAKDALEQALEVNPPDGQAWLSGYAIDMPADIVEAIPATSDDWFAVLDNDFNLRTFDKNTGKLRATCAFPDDFKHNDNVDASLWKVVAGGNYVVACPTRSVDNGGVICFDATTGEELWRMDGVGGSGICISADSTRLGIAVVGNNMATAASIDIASGAFVGHQATIRANLYYNGSTPCTFGETNDDLYLASGGRLVHMDFANDTNAAADLPLNNPISISYSNGIVVVTSLQTMEETDGHGVSSYQDIPYAISAFACNGRSLDPLWSDSGTFGVAMMDTDSGDPMVTSSLPSIRPVTSLGQSMFVFTAGSTIRVYATVDGTLLSADSTPAPIFGTQATSNDTASQSLVAVTSADGSLDMKDPANLPQDKLANALDFSFPCRLQEAHYDGTNWALGVSADQRNRLVVYRLRSADNLAKARQEDDQEYGIGFLRAYAELTLEDAGQSSAG